MNLGAIAVTMTAQPHLRVIVAAFSLPDKRPVEWASKWPAHHTTKCSLLGRVDCWLEDDAANWRAQRAIGIAGVVWH